MNVEEYIRMKKKIDSLRQKKARAEGALEVAEGRLEDELGVPVSEASERTAEMKREVERLRELADRKLDEFGEKWRERLEEVG